MFRKLLKYKKAQSTAEFALLIALVVAGIIAMQTYAQRALQGRIRDAASFLTQSTNSLGNTLQYEPYYLQTDYTVVRDDETGKIQDAANVKQVDFSNRVRNGFQEQQYNRIAFPELAPIGL